MNNRLVPFLKILLVASLFAGPLMGVFHGHCDEVSHLEHEQSETQGHHDDHQEEENGCSLCELASGGDDLSVVSAVLKFDLDSWVVRSVALADTHLKSVTNYSFQRAPPRLA